MGRELAAGLLACTVLAGCGGGGVDWDMYSPTVKERIDSAAADGDCATLQQEFDTAEANDGLTRARTGEGNADLMGYIDDALRDAGCYD